MRNFVSIILQLSPLHSTIKQKKIIKLTYSLHSLEQKLEADRCWARPCWSNNDDMCLSHDRTPGNEGVPFVRTRSHFLPYLQCPQRKHNRKKFEVAEYSCCAVGFYNMETRLR